MPDYQKMYFQLAAKVADAIELLIDAQTKAEEQFIKEESTAVQFVSKDDNLHPDNDP